YVDRFELIVRLTAGERWDDPLQRLMSTRDRRRHLVGGRSKAIGATAFRNVVLVRTVGRVQWRQTIEAVGGLRLLQASIEPRAMVEDEAHAVVVSAAALLEILEDAAFELKDVLEAFALHVRTLLLAAN